ncbi:MAG: hypothetical protein KAT40_00835 [Bacteroidales bacterium]|nr:hypothetical protein [Bacteroidales bacterium]
MLEIPPLLILLIGIIIVIGLIIFLRLNAFFALITASIIVSLLAPGEFSEKISRVAMAFGSTAGKIGIVIALAAVIGRCLIESGAADRIVQWFVRLFGKKNCSVSLMSSGFLLSIPVFFDTVFYLLIPLARSMHRRTKINYVLLVLAMGAGASITHSLVPPTPGPLIMAETLGIDLGFMIAIGILVAIPAAIIIMFFIKYYSRRMDIPMRPIEGAEEESEPLPDDRLPGLLTSLLPIILPLLMISAHTIVSTLAKGAEITSNIKQAEEITAVLGNANLAMLVSAIIALIVFYRQRRPKMIEFGKSVETALMSGGIIILITSAGGAFGAMLKEAQVGPAIQAMFGNGADQQLGGIGLLFMSFLIASLLKFAQGSTTVSMITTSAMIATMLPSPEIIGFHPVYIAAAIGFGAQCGAWMNDSGFWIYAKMSGFTGMEAIKTWTVTLAVMAIVGFLITLFFATFLPLV